MLHGFVRCKYLRTTKTIFEHLFFLFIESPDVVLLTKKWVLNILGYTSFNTVYILLQRLEEKKSISAFHATFLAEKAWLGTVDSIPQLFLPPHPTLSSDLCLMTWVTKKCPQLCASTHINSFVILISERYGFHRTLSQE